MLTKERNSDMKAFEIIFFDLHKVYYKIEKSVKRIVINWFLF